MQVLIDVHCSAELERLISKLHSSGIPTFHKKHGGRRGYYWVLFVRVDSQLEEAHNLLADPSYIVKNKVSVEDHLMLINEEANTQISASTLGDLTMIAIILAVVIGALIIRAAA